MGDQKLAPQAIVLNEEQKSDILERISKGEKMLSICRDIGLSVRTFNLILIRDTLFSKEVASARVIAAHAAVERLDSIYDHADTMTDVQRARGQSENIRWLASKLVPDVYGDRLQVDHRVTVDLTKVLEQASGRLITHLSNQSEVIDATVTPLIESNSDDSSNIE